MNNKKLEELHLELKILQERQTLLLDDIVNCDSEITKLENEKKEIMLEIINFENKVNELAEAGCLGDLSIKEKVYNQRDKLASNEKKTSSVRQEQKTLFDQLDECIDKITDVMSTIGNLKSIEENIHHK